MAKYSFLTVYGYINCYNISKYNSSIFMKSLNKYCCEFEKTPGANP